jgi:hypothetical protein
VDELRRRDPGIASEYEIRRYNINHGVRTLINMGREESLRYKELYDILDWSIYFIIIRHKF